MKTAEHWTENLVERERMWPSNVEWVRAIQADALESAAQIADVYDYEDANERIRLLIPKEPA